MNAKATDRLPFITILEMSKKFPEDYALQRALAERDQFCKELRNENSKDKRDAERRQLWLNSRSY